MSDPQRTGFAPSWPTNYGAPYYQQYPHTQQLSATQSLPPYNPLSPPASYQPSLGSYSSHSLTSHQYGPISTEQHPVASAPPEDWAADHSFSLYPNPNASQDAHLSQTFIAEEEVWSEYIPVPRNIHQPTESLIDKINDLTRPFLLRDLRPETNAEPVEETYDALKHQWRENRNRYPESYQIQMNGAIRETDKIVGSSRLHAVRQKMFLLTLVALGVLTLFGTHFMDRRYIAPNTLSIAKTICKIIAGVTFFQLAFSNSSHEKRLAASYAQLYLREARNNPDLVIEEQ